MGMALFKDVDRARRACGQAKPIDLVHLSTQTAGDASLEAEILSLFKAQVTSCRMVMEKGDTPDLRREAAHRLKGAARGVGAFELARLAGIAEESGNVPGQFSAEADAVLAYIANVTAGM